MTTAALEAPQQRVENSEHLVVATRVHDLIQAMEAAITDAPDPATDRDLGRWHRFERALADAARQFLADGD